MPVKHHVEYNPNTHLYLQVPPYSFQLNEKKPCFKKDTKILTKSGYKNIQNLSPNDILMKIDGTYTNISRIISYPNKIVDNLYLLKKNSVSIGVPNNDLYISDNHFINHRGTIVLPKLNKLFIKLRRQYVQYFHIETDDYKNDWIIANNIGVETFGDNNNNNLKIRRYRLMLALK